MPTEPRPQRLSVALAGAVPVLAANATLIIYHIFQKNQPLPGLKLKIKMP